MFCSVSIDPESKLTNDKLIDDIIGEIADGLKIQQLQNILAKEWKPCMKALDTMYTDSTCYESEMRHPTGQKLLWDCGASTSLRQGRYCAGC